MKHLRLPLLSAALLLGPAAHAAVVMAVDERELTLRAHTVAFGSVIQAVPVMDARGRISTRAAVQVYQAVHGCAVGEVLTVEVPGGTVGNLSMEIDGAPKVRAGDLVFGFFERHGAALRPLGLSYGWLRVRAAAPGDYRVWRDLGGLALVGAGGAPVDEGGLRLADVPLGELVQRVRAYREASRPLGPPSAPAEVRR